MPVSDQLTRRQQAVLAFLEARDNRGESPPTLDEICAGMALKSKGSLHKHIAALTRAGLVRAADGLRRGVRLRRRVRRPGALPWLGTIAAGEPIEAVCEPVEMEVPAFLRADGDCYLLKVRGDSMVEEGIMDGDWVVIEKREQARNGEIVVALIDESAATLKRIQQQPGRVILYPANQRLNPQTYSPERVRIQGVLRGQMRSYGH